MGFLAIQIMLADQAEANRSKSNDASKLINNVEGIKGISKKKKRKKGNIILV